MWQARAFVLPSFRLSEHLHPTIEPRGLISRIYEPAKDREERMLCSSVRRVAFAVPSSPITASVTSSAPRAAASQALSYRSHQRRHSSSKPSSPANGPKGIAEGQAVPTSPARLDDEKKGSSRNSRRKTKDTAERCAVKAKEETMPNLPSVPSTHHLKTNGRFGPAV